jgi:cobalt/nickel transport system permease protein
MHIPDGFLSAPVYLAGYAVSGAVCAVAAVRANRRLGEREVPLLGMTAAFIFAAQMLNFPVAGGTSGHFLGATLAAVLLGPLNACLVMAIVLLIQCLGFADGGLTALGANLFNMGIIGAVGGWLLFRALQAVLPRSRWGFLAAAAAASWTAVVVAAVFCAFELDWSGTSPLRAALPAMAGVHALIGIGEAVITAAVLSSVLAVRPDLVAAWRPTAASTG